MALMSSDAVSPESASVSLALSDAVIFVAPASSEMLKPSWLATGVSFCPVIVTVTVAVAVAEPLSVMV